MNKKDIRTLSYVFCQIANRMDSFSGDLFIDFPKCLDMFSEGKPFTIFVGRGHSDISDRFSYAGNTMEARMKECARTLGLDFSVEICRDSATVSDHSGCASRCRSLSDSLKDIFASVQVESALIQK